MFKDSISGTKSINNQVSLDDTVFHRQLEQILTITMSIQYQCQLDDVLMSIKSMMITNKLLN